MTLVRFALRELRRMKWRAALVALVVALTVGAFAGGTMAERSLYHTRDHYYRVLKFMHLEVMITPLNARDNKEIPDLRGIPGVAAVTKRLIFAGYWEPPGKQPLLTLTVYLDATTRPTVNDIQLTEGRWLDPKRPDEVVIDRTFAEVHGLKIGDTLLLNPMTINEARFTVRGVAISPEFLTPTANPDTLFPAKGSLGIVFANRSKIDAVFTDDELVNNLAFRFKPGADHKAVRKAILARLRTRIDSADIQRLTPWTDHFGYRFLEEDLKGFGVFVPVLVLIMVVIGVVVTLIGMNRLIAARQREIGTLMALGYRPGGIALPFLIVGIVPGAIGGVIGIPLAFVWSDALARGYAEIVGLPPVVPTYSAAFLLIAFGLGLLVTVIATLIPLWQALRQAPITALRGESEIVFRGLPKVVERTIRRGATTVKIALRNLLRRPKVTLATVLLVALSLGMTASFLTSMTSWTQWADTAFQKEPWDAVASFKVPLKPADALARAKKPGVKAVEFYVSGTATVNGEETRVMGLTPNAKLRRFEWVAGRGFSSPTAHEVIVNRNFTDKPQRLGELVTIERDKRVIKARIVGIVSDLTMKTVFVPLKTAQQILQNKGKVSGFFSQFDRPLNEVRKRLLADEMGLVTTVTLKKDVEKVVQQYMASFMAVLYPSIAMSIIMSFFFVLSAMGILLLEREGEFATLRAFGFGRGEIAKIILIEVLLLGALAVVASLPLWLAFSWIIDRESAKVWFEIGLVFRSADLSTVALPIFIVLPFAAWPGIHRMLALNLSDTLRRRLIG